MDLCDTCSVKHEHPLIAIKTPLDNNWNLNALFPGMYLIEGADISKPPSDNMKGRLDLFLAGAPDCCRGGTVQLTLLSVWR